MKPILLTFLSILLALPLGGVPGWSEEAQAPHAAPEARRPELDRAVMCEDVRDRTPYHPAVVFSVAGGRVYCFTHFDPVPKKMMIHHRWYRRESLTSKIALYVNPPEWSTFSNIQLRESDKGPWRVEVTDADGHIFQILRFSVTD